MANIHGGNELINPQKLFSNINLKPGMKVADLGCGGSGQFVLPAAKIVGEKGLVYAVDILKTALQSVVGKARLQGLANVRTVWSNLEIVGATKIPNGSLDAAFLINILFQSDKHEDVFKEAIRLIKPGGQLLVVDWKKVDLFFGAPAELRVNPKKIEEIASRQGLKLVSEFSAGHYHFGLIFKKQ